MMKNGNLNLNNFLNEEAKKNAPLNKYNQLKNAANLFISNRLSKENKAHAKIKRRLNQIISKNEKPKNLDYNKAYQKLNDALSKAKQQILEEMLNEKSDEESENYLHHTNAPLNKYNQLKNAANLFISNRLSKENKAHAKIKRRLNQIISKNEKPKNLDYNKAYQKLDDALSQAKQKISEEMLYEESDENSRDKNFEGEYLKNSIYTEYNILVYNTELFCKNLPKAETFKEIQNYLYNTIKDNQKKISSAKTTSKEPEETYSEAYKILHAKLLAAKFAKDQKLSKQNDRVEINNQTLESETEENSISDNSSNNATIKDLTSTEENKTEENVIFDENDNTVKIDSSNNTKIESKSTQSDINSINSHVADQEKQKSIPDNNNPVNSNKGEQFSNGVLKDLMDQVEKFIIKGNYRWVSFKSIGEKPKTDLFRHNEFWRGFAKRHNIRNYQKNLITEVFNYVKNDKESSDDKKIKMLAGTLAFVNKSIGNEKGNKFASKLQKITGHILKINNLEQEDVQKEGFQNLNSVVKNAGKGKDASLKLKIAGAFSDVTHESKQGHTAIKAQEDLLSNQANNNHQPKI